jgi:hypothetical protein
VRALRYSCRRGGGDITLDVGESWPAQKAAAVSWARSVSRRINRRIDKLGFSVKVMKSLPALDFAKYQPLEMMGEPWPPPP